MMKLATWKQPILSILVLTIVFSLTRFLWREAGGGDSSMAIFTYAFTATLIAKLIIRFVNRKQNKALNDLPQ